HDDRDRARPGDRPRGSEERRGRREPDGVEEGHRGGRRGRRREPQDPVEAGLGQGGHRPRCDRLLARARDRRGHRRRDREGRQGRRRERRGGADTRPRARVHRGMQFDKGYLSPYMVTDAERMEAVLDEPYILVANQKIGAVKDLLPILEQVIQAGKPLLIVAEDVEGESLATIVVNKLRGTFTAVAVKAP